MIFLRTLLVAIGLLSGVNSLGAKENPPTRPNILFAIADDWSHGHASIAGCQWINTPGFDRVAKNGVRFTNAFTPNAKCCPSRSILLTGRYSWQLEAAANHICFFPAKFKVYPEVLTENGYFTGFTGKGWGPGVANDAQGKKRLMTGQGFNRRRYQPAVKQVSANDYAANFNDFLDASPKGKPWCFWYGSTEPHRGYQKGAGLAKGKKLTDIKHVPKFWPDNETIRGDILDYAVEVEHFDSHLDRMLKELEKRGQLENTIVIATSDHGMPFPRCKGQAYNYSNHVPMVIMWKQGLKNPGRVVEDSVSFIDIAPTFLELAGLKWNQTGMADTPGKSLTDILFSEKSGQVNPDRTSVLIGKERHDIGRPNDAGYPIRGIVSGGFLYIKNHETDRWPGGNPETGYLNCDGSPTKTEILQNRINTKGLAHWQLCFGKRPAEELYDLKQDPDCVRNLLAFQSEKQKETRNQLASALEKLLKEQGDPRMFGKGDVFDEYIYSSAGTRNFYERYMKGEKVKAGWVNPSDFEKKPLD